MLQSKIKLLKHRLINKELMFYNISSLNIPLIKESYRLCKKTLGNWTDQGQTEGCRAIDECMYVCMNEWRQKIQVNKQCN
jgi:hypothetical protein